MITYDLKSGYHHIDIADVHQKYLGFSWVIGGVNRYFEFNVLPFGLSSAPLLFTKMMKPLITHWRASGILIALYLDDGFCVIPIVRQTKYLRKEVSKHVKIDLLRAGLIYNVEKSPVGSILAYSLVRHDLGHGCRHPTGLTTSC